MKQTLGTQVVSTVPVKHILLLQHLHEPPSPVSTARPMWLTCGHISHEAVRGPRAGAGPCTLGYTNVVAVALAKTAATVRRFLTQLLGNGWGLRGGVEMGTYWRPTVPNPHANPNVRYAVSEI